MVKIKRANIYYAKIPRYVNYMYCWRRYVTMYTHFPSLQEVIPVLKENLHSECTPDLLSHIRQYVMSLILIQEQRQVS